MLGKLLSLVPHKKQRSVAYAVGGMASLLVGQKVGGLALFVKGCKGIEEEWRAANPEFNGDFSARWDRALRFYEDSHRDPTNRKLHMIGIPMIVGGAAGLLLFRPFRPFWLASASTFATGWGLNIAGHVFFEHNAPAFADDPLSFIAGPVWDLKNGGEPRTSNAASAGAPARTVVDVNAVEINVTNAEPAVA